MLSRLGKWSFQNPRKVFGAWIVLGIVVIGSAVTIGAAFDAPFEIPDSESRRGYQALDTHFGGLGSGQRGSIVFRADTGVDDPAVRMPMEALFAEVTMIDGVIVSSPYELNGAGQVNGDRTIAFASLTLAPNLDFTDTADIGMKIVELSPQVDGLQIEVGGQALAPFEPPESEFIGLAFAVVVLILAFGSVIAMGLPIAVAVAGVGVGAGLIMLLSNLMPMPDFTTTLGAMLGLGVGIDYSLFVVTRYREGLDEGRSPLEATVKAMDTAGRAVMFAGLTVVISLLGMLVTELAFVTGLAIGAATTVALIVVASITLLPALLGFARERLEVTRWRAIVAAGLVSLALLGVGLGLRPLLFAGALSLVVYVAGAFVPLLNREVPRRPERPKQERLAYRWSRTVQAHPWTALIIGVGLLLVLSAPVLSLRLGFSDEGNFPVETTTRRAYDLLVEGFGAGFNGPLLVVAEIGTPTDRAALPSLLKALERTPGVAVVTPPVPSDLNDANASLAYLIQVVPTTSPQDKVTADLLEVLRNEIVPFAIAGSTLAVNITGLVAVDIDFSSYLAKRIVLFFGAVLALSFLLLMMVFRSILVPVKAVVMNVLSIGAAYGVIVAMFQWGWLGGLIGIAGAPIEPFVPLMMFAIVFGLSMDYEVFLLSRVKEEFDRTNDAVGSVADGLASTARVITAAAAIMVVVFGSFVFEDTRVIKLFGVGLAVAVLLDATLVRMLLVPATMELLGARNWWLPGWLDRVLPRINMGQ